MQRMYRIGLHIVYLLLAMVVAAFVHAPLLTRITILGLVPLNLVTYLKHGMEACLDFTSMTVLILLITTSTYQENLTFVNALNNIYIYSAFCDDRNSKLIWIKIKECTNRTGTNSKPKWSCKWNFSELCFIVV